MRHSLPLALVLATTTLITGCAGVGDVLSSTVGRVTGKGAGASSEMVYAVTESAELIRFRADQPQLVLARVPLRGLGQGERLLGMDFRLRPGEPGQLFALSSRGRIFTVDTTSGQLQSPARARPVLLAGQRFGVDFNPTADRLQVISDIGQNVALNPDTGAVADSGQPLRYAGADGRQASMPALVASAHAVVGSVSTRYGIDPAAGTLVSLGSSRAALGADGDAGQLHTVGPLGTGPVDDARLDIPAGRGEALAVLRQGERSRLYSVNLGSGQAKALGLVADGRPLWGIAIAP